MNARALFALSPLLFLACAGGHGGEPSYPASTSSPYSAGTSFAPPPSAAAVPTREFVSAGIVVRPDLVCVPFAVRVVDPDADHAVSAARATAEQLGAALRAAAGGQGTLRMRGIAVGPAMKYSKTGAATEEGYALVADGAFEVALPATMDFWTRSKLVSALVAASKREMAARAEQPAKVSFEVPQLRVADPEAHRAQLTKQWVERAKAFADAAQPSSSAPLVLVDCAAPGEISQRNVSTEEVQLTLSIACRLDARPIAAK